MNLYHVTDMEGGLRLACERNSRVVANLRSFTSRPIRLRKKPLQDIPSVTHFWGDPFREKQIAIWRESKKLLYGKWSLRNLNDFPQTDCIFFAESPYFYSDLEAFATKAKFEVVVYRPPTWELHEEVVERNWPHYEFARVIIEAARARKGLPVDDLIASALTDPWQVGFRAADLEAITGASPIMIRKAVGRIKRRGACYVPMLPIVAPLMPALMPDYERICALPERPGGYRLVPFSTATTRVSYALTRCGSMRREAPVFVIDTRLDNFKWLRTNVEMSMQRAEWFKMKTMLDNSPELPR